MITVTSEVYHDKLSVHNNEIILNGPPNNLRGFIHLRNNHDEKLNVKNLGLTHNKKHAAMFKSNLLLNVSCRLQPGEERLESVSHQINPQTHPGTYESTLNIGGQMHKVKMVVQPNIEISIYPNNFTFQGTEPGKVHTTLFTLTNKGNMPFQVPDIKHVAALDMDMLCKAFGIGFREKTAETYNQVLDAITKNVKNNLTDWAKATVEEKGHIVEPGANTLIHVNITLPNNCDAKNDYNGNMRFWDKDISYNVKSHTTKSKSSK